MASVFTRVINGELPGRFVWRDERCVAILSIAPLAQGHTLVVPIEPVDHWIDASPDLLAHLTTVSQTIAAAIQAAFTPTKVGLMIAGLEVSHLHLHLTPIHNLHDMDFAKADNSPAAESMDDAMEKIQAALSEAGHGDHIPS